MDCFAWPLSGDIDAGGDTFGLWLKSLNDDRLRAPRGLLTFGELLTPGSWLCRASGCSVTSRVRDTVIFESPGMLSDLLYNRCEISSSGVPGSEVSYGP